MVLYPAVSLVSINPAGSHNHPARDTRALAQGRLSLLLALEVAPPGRATADRHGAARVDPADEHGESALGCATHSRRTAQTRVRGRTVFGGKYGRLRWRIPHENPNSRKFERIDRRVFPFRYHRCPVRRCSTN